MIRIRRWMLVLSVAALLAVMLWWTLYVPYRPERLFRAVPLHATLVGRHRNLAQRWDDVYANPLVLSLFMSAGVKPSVLKQWADDPKVRPWFNRLAGRDVVIAYVPPRYSHADPTWVIASWLGGDSQRLRWQMGWQRSGEFLPRPPRHGHPYWRVMTPDIEPGTVLCVALVEGIIIGCLSDSEDSMIEILDTFDGLRPSIQRRAEHPTFTPAHMTNDVWDAVWMEASGLGLARVRGYPLGLEFREIRRTTLVCRAYLHGLRAPQAAPCGNLEDLSRVLGDAPVWMAAFPPNGLIMGQSKAMAFAWQRALHRLAAQQNAGVAVMALLDARFAGRIAGIRIPAVLLALPLTQPEKANAQISAALDEINARSRWGLIPYPWARVGETEIVVVEGTGQNLYSSLAPEEKPAYAVCGKWLLLAGQASGLKQLLEQQAMAFPACWHKVVSESAPFWIWGDFRLGNEMLRLALSAYAFKLVVHDAAGTQQRRQRLNEWKAWLDAFEPLQQCAVRAEPWEAGGLILDVRLGRFCR